jgi:hypothetical protein
MRTGGVWYIHAILWVQIGRLYKGKSPEVYRSFDASAFTGGGGMGLWVLAGKSDKGESRGDSPLARVWGVPYYINSQGGWEMIGSSAFPLIGLFSFAGNDPNTMECNNGYDCIQCTGRMHYVALLMGWVIELRQR